MPNDLNDIFDGLLRPGEAFTEAAGEVFKPSGRRPKQTARSQQRAADNADITLRPLQPSEWPFFRTCMQKLTESEKSGLSAKAYADSIDKSLLTEWQRGSHNGVIGIFDKDGPAGVFTVQPVGSRIAQLANVWLEERLRGRGVVDKIYDHMIAWAQADTDIKYLTMTHRIGNVASRAMAERMGFTYACEQGETFRDDPERIVKRYIMQVRARP